MAVYLARLDSEIRIDPLMTTRIVQFWCWRPLGKLLGARSNHGLYCSEPRATLKGILPVNGGHAVFAVKIRYSVTIDGLRMLK